MEMERIESEYKEVFDLLKAYKDLYIFDIERLEMQSKCHLFGLELVEKYGIDINPKSINSPTYFSFDRHRIIGYFGESTGRRISWPDDGRQPDNELLLQISFPSGAYIFGDHYPKDLFNSFFEELKEFNPEYLDTENKCLYFSMENAKGVFNSFENILKKYKKLNIEERKKLRIEQIKRELESLESKNK